MSREIISSFDSFVKKFPELKKLEKNTERVEGLKKYFKKGGVISAVSVEGKWPKLLYPNHFKVSQEIKAIERKLSLLDKKKKSWDKRFDDAKAYNSRNRVKKFFDPLYWRHLKKSIIDGDYRKDVKSVKMPVNMVSEPKYRPMIEAFLNDFDYRKQLTETVLTSIVYEKDRRVAKYAEELRNFRMETSNKNSESMQKKINYLAEEMKVLQQVLEWAKE